MKYRIVLTVGYYDAWYDFETIEEAAKFVKIALKHQVPSKDTKKEGTCIKIDIVPEDSNAVNG